MEKLQKWAAAGNLMPTHRVRNAESTEWIIAAYVPGLEQTMAATAPAAPAASRADGKSVGSRMRGLGRKKKKRCPASKRRRRASPADGLPLTSGEPPDIVALCDEIMEIAFERGASDIHIDPEENIVLIQLRVDGKLEPFRKLPKSIHTPLIGRYKVLSRDGHRRAPHGPGRPLRPSARPEKRKIHLRAAILPTTHGERITLRLLAVETEQLTLNRSACRNRRSEHSPTTRPNRKA